VATPLIFGFYLVYQKKIASSTKKAAVKKIREEGRGKNEQWRSEDAASWFKVVIRGVEK
jgi:hypothetical protein